MPDTVVPLALEIVAEGWPTVVWCPVEVTQPSGSVDRYQLVLALHRVPATAAEPDALIGVVAAPSGTAHVYDALADPAGSLLLTRRIAPNLKIEAPEPLRNRDGRTSIVRFDDRWELTLYRRLDTRPEPDISVPLAVARRSVGAVNPAVVTWHERGWDLAAIRRESGRAPDGLEVARRSLSELLHRRCPPSETRADIWPDAEALGRAVAEVHVGLAAVFGHGELDGSRLRDELLSRLRHGAPGRLDLSGVEAAVQRLGPAVDLGYAVRVHGDLHLGNVIRERRGWQLRGFANRDESWSSPLNDVARMIRSVRQAATLAASERATVGSHLDARSPELSVERTVDREARLLADAWVERATTAFVAGYTSVSEIHELLPSDRTARDALVAVYELADDLDHLKWEVARGTRAIDLRDRDVIRLVGTDLVDRR